MSGFALWIAVIKLLNVWLAVYRSPDGEWYVAELEWCRGG